LGMGNVTGLCRKPRKWAGWNTEKYGRGHKKKKERREEAKWWGVSDLTGKVSSQKLMTSKNEEGRHCMT